MGFAPNKITVRRRRFGNKRLQIHPADYLDKVPQAVQNSCGKNFENQSRKEKLKLKTDPLVGDLAKISALAYKDCKLESGVIQLKMPPATEELCLKEEDCKLEGYTPICYAKKGSYYGCALIKAETNESPCQVIIAHRGTENWNDWEDLKADLEGICISLFTSQLNSACTFSLEVVKFVLGAIPQGGSPIQIILTGHSLGGWLAQISTFAVKYVKIGKDKTGNSCFCRREDKLNPRCIVFDSPGAYPMLRKLYEMDNIRDSSASLRLDITNYVISPNSVNCIHAHFGDTFLIPTDKIQRFVASKIITITGLHIGYTIESHDKMLFVQELAKISHGNGKPIVRVTNWPRVTFGCCPAEVESPSFVVKTVCSVAFAAWNKNIFGEYKKWLKTKKDNFKLGAEMVVDKHCYTLNEVEIEVMEQIKKICLCKNFCKPDSLYDTDENNMFKFVIDNFADCNWLRSDIYVKFKDKSSLQALRNCSLFSISFQQISDKISTNVVPLFAESEKNRKYLEEHYLALKFICYKEIEDICKLDGQDHIAVVDKCKAKLQLFLLKIISFCSQKSKRTLILRYDEIRNFLNITGDRYGDVISDIDLVLVDCINSETDIAVNVRIKEGCKHIWLIGEGNFSPNSGQTIKVSSKDLELDRVSVGEILKNKVELLGELVPLQDFIGVENCKKLEFAEFLTKNPKDMLTLVMKNPQLIKVGTSPPTLFDFDNNYFEVGEKFSYLQDAICYVNKKPILLTRTGDGRDVGYMIVICTNSESEIPCEFWKNLNCNDNIRIVKDDANSFQEFQKICGKNPSSFVDLLYYSSGFFELRSQYNPGFYITRNIYEPGVNLRLLCEWRARDDNFTLYLGREKVDTKQAQALAKILPAEYRNQIHSGKIVLGRNSSSVVHTVKEFLNPKAIWPRNQNVVYLTSNSERCKVVMYENEFGVEGKEHFSIWKCKSSDEKVFNSNDIIILSDEPGMGKSTTIVKLSNAVMALNGGSKPWVIFIELKHLQNIPDDDLCIDKIVTCFSGYFNYTEIEYILLRNSLTQNDTNGIKIFFFFDGFDEMDNNSQKSFMMVLKWLNSNTNVRICISTRDHDKTKLESGLCVMAHHFEPFDEDGFVQFLVKCWIGFAKQWENEIKDFARIKIKQLRKYLYKEYTEFFGVPLQLKMISEIFSTDIFDAVVGNNVDKLTIADSETMIAEGYTVTKLYEEFIQKKYKIYFCNKLNLKPETYFKSSKIGFTESFERALIILAAETLAGDQVHLSDCFKKLIALQYGTLGLTCGEDELDGAYAVGIVRQSKRKGTEKSSKQIPEFPHRTFADFYLAKLLFMCIKSVCFGVGYQLFDSNSSKVNLVEVFRSYVFPSGGFVVRTFLNDMIASDNEMLSVMKNFNGLSYKLGYITDTPEHKTFQFGKRELSWILEEKHTFLLEFVLSFFHIYKDEAWACEIVPLLTEVEVFPGHFFMDDYTTLKPLFIILHCISKHYTGKLEDMKFVFITKYRWDRIQHPKPTSLFSLSSVKYLPLEKIDPFAYLLFSQNNALDFSKYLEVLVNTWGDPHSAENFKWQRYTRGTKAEAISSKILKDVNEINSSIANLPEFQEALEYWSVWFEKMYGLDIGTK